MSDKQPMPEFIFQNSTHAFYRECLQLDHDRKVDCKSVYILYCAWMQQQSHLQSFLPPTQRKFTRYVGNNIHTRGYRRNGGVLYYDGIYPKDGITWFQPQSESIVNPSPTA